jgi:aldehyde dehydrogenase (NAD+)
MQEEIFGPVLVSTTFRTPEEAVACQQHALRACGDGLDREREPRARHRAEAGGGGGLGERHQPLRRGGGLRRRARKRVRARRRVGGAAGLPEARAERRRRCARRRRCPPRATPWSTGIDRTAKLYIGGKQARPDGGYSRAVWSPRAASFWAMSARQPQGHPQRGRGRPCREGLGERPRGMPARRSSTTSPRTSRPAPGEFAGRLRDLTGKPGAAEVEASIQRLFTYAAWADKYDGARRACRSGAWRWR